jgi:hypothetical protein
MALPFCIFDLEKGRRYYLLMKMGHSHHEPAVQLDILAFLPGSFASCPNCELWLKHTGVRAEVNQEHRADFPPELLEESDRLAEWIGQVAQRYGRTIRIRVMDPQSVQGLWKSLRHGIHRYPAFIINGRLTYIGWDRDQLEALLEQAIRQVTS